MHGAPDDALESTIARAVEAAGLDESYVPVIRGYVEDTSDLWRVCCSTHCNPCMQDLGTVVDQVRSEREPS
ncbi:MAG: hypothetical protein KDB80_11795 [Planctomycetes bacterium]|nr:hypothetical protein [Planctomycetota bacterium]